ncbi:hypothetical protein DFH08DRAFT_475008 [Mycena albidolilacea]|uniref:Copper acquisition factor BIM1-like domain-containing protein n=1 Tax=Mycena albidolilacea TaxID=1033008 RepID=A0AAD7AFF3_9AGAR|nr:hypothetical protein DFH08DRAFT_475008 [Mycena albidolilacea]
MLASTSLVFASLIALANAHFQLQFPAARGAFSEDNEPKFCDGFDNPASSRTAFPITGGFFKLNSEHASWTVGVNLSSSTNPTKFADFGTTLFPFTKESGEGVSCFPLDLSSAGLSDGQNVTIEVVFDGSDGTLYQCADLTISTSAKVSDPACNITTTSPSGSASGSSGTPTAPASSGSPSASAPPSGGAVALGAPVGYLALLVSLVGVAAGAVIV